MTDTTPTVGTARVKRGMAEMLKGGVIMDVVTPDQAKIAEDAGAVAVMALERVPADIRAQGGVARMSDPDMIDGIVKAVSIPVMAKARIGHFVEAQLLEALGVDYIDESEVLSPADYANHIDKWAFTVPFVCGATNLGEALRRINEGAAMIRSKGEAGTGDVSNAVTHMRTISAEIRRLSSLREDELYVAAKDLQAPYELVKEVAAAGKLPVVVEGADARVLRARSDQHFTEPPPRYSEASLVKKMEELGIGRPSTYASILSVLQDRNYVRLDKRRFIPEDRGRLVTAFLVSFFDQYLEIRAGSRIIAKFEL